MLIYKVLVCGLFLIMAVSTAFSDAPKLLNYQGKLFDDAGEPIPDGAYSITFSIYDSPSAGIMKWSENKPSIQIKDGLFNTVMGSVVPLEDSVFMGSDRFLEISINGQPLAPRTQFTSVSYAHRISTVDGASAGELSGSLRLSPSDFTQEGNAFVVVDNSDNPVVDISVDEVGSTVMSFYDPVDSYANPGKAALGRVMDFSISPDGIGSLSFYDPADSFSKAAAVKLADLTVSPGGIGSLSFYDPADSKAGLEIPKVKITKNGLIMFGATESDTNLVVEPNGDISGLGQITMGQNSNDGVNTAVLGYNNDGSGDSAAIGGGSYNVASGAISVIGGGFGNTADGIGSVVGGGSLNEAMGDYSTIAGGYNNQALGDYAMIPGGDQNTANGLNSFSAGFRAKAEHNGVFVWADQTDEDFGSTGDDQFIIRATGGVGIGTNSPTGLLDVSGFDGDGSVNLPTDAISSPEILNEPGVAADFGDITPIVLIQGTGIMQDLTIATITIPTDGYIIVRGGGILRATGTQSTGALTGANGENKAYMQVDETPGGTLAEPFFTYAGPGHSDSPNREHNYSMSTERIFTKAAGTYEFRLEAMASPNNSSGATTAIVAPYITVMFVPTAYGTVYSSGN